MLFSAIIHHFCYEEGLEEGWLTGARDSIVETITIRFNPSIMEYRQVERQLRGLAEQEQLQQVLAAAIQAETMAVFAARQLNHCGQPDLLQRFRGY